MSVAAMEAVVLGKHLPSHSTRADPLDGLAGDYLTEIQDCLEAPWATAVSDFRPSADARRTPARLRQADAIWNGADQSGGLTTLTSTRRSPK